MKLLRIKSGRLCGTQRLGAALLNVALLAAGSHAAPAQTTADLVERYMTTVQAEFASKVDTKNAAAGQKVILLTKKPATLADGTELPKGTRLVGRVVEVHASGNERSGSALTLIFDQAELGGGKVVPVRSMMRTLSGATANPAAGGFGPNDGIRADQQRAVPGIGLDPRGGLGGNDGPGSGGLGSGGLGSGGLGGGGGGLGGGSLGGGGLGGGIGGGSGGSQTTRRGVGPAMQVPAVIPDGTTPAEGPRATREGGVTVGSAPQATGMDGVLLAKKIVGPDGVAIDASGTLIGMGRNIHLESGTLIVLGVIGR